jgi:hypothetical protein
MVKLLLFIVVGYLAYHMILKPLVLGPPADQQQKGKEPKSGEYIDYEEVDK